MTSINFWQKWLLVTTILVILFGTLLILPIESEILDLMFNDRIEAIFWPDTMIAPGVTHFRQWLYGVLGATMVGWGIMMAFITAGPFHKRETWAWYSIALSIGIWYIADTIVSISYGALFNAAFNTAILLLFLPPMLGTFKSFHSTQSEFAAPQI
jgi:hypothetical protein